MLRNNLLIIFFIFLSGCDFTPPLNKKIIEAQSLIRDRNYEEAINRYQVILKDNPPSAIKVKILYQVGDLYSIYLSEIEESLNFYEEVIKIAEDERWKTKSIERLGDLHFTHLKNYQDAIFYFQKLLYLTTDKSKLDFYEYQIAKCYFKLSRYEIASQKLNEITTNENHLYFAKAIYLKGMIFYYSENWDEAIKEFEKYISRETNRDDIVEAKFILANALESRENLNMAYDIYSSILGEYPNTQVVKDKLEAIYNRRVARKRN